MTDTIIQNTTRKKRDTFRKFFQRNPSKSSTEANIGVNTVDKINSLYKSKKIGASERTKTSKFRNFLSFSRKPQYNVSTEVEDDYEIGKNSSFKFTLKRTFSKLKNKKLEDGNSKKSTIGDHADNGNKDAFECYNKFKSTSIMTNQKHELPPSLQNLDFDVKPFKFSKGSLRKQNSLNKKPTLDIGGDDPSTNLDPFSPLTEDTNTLLEPFEGIEFEKDDAFNKENALDFPKLAVVNKTVLSDITDKQNMPSKGFAKEKEQSLLYENQTKKSISDSNIAITTSPPILNLDNAKDITDIEQSPQYSDTFLPGTLSNEEINSSETLKEVDMSEKDVTIDVNDLKQQNSLSPDKKDFSKNAECSNSTIEVEDNTNVKCLAIPTFREDDVIGLEDYIRGHELGRFTQLDILESMQNENAGESQIIEKIKDTFDDFRNPSFYSGNSEDDNKYYTCDDTYDNTSVIQTVRSIGSSKNKESSKLKFNLLSEVFYYDKNAETKGSKCLSVLETIKKESDAEEKEEPFMLLKENVNLLLNSNSTEVSAADAFNILDFSKLDNIKHLLTTGSRNNDKIEITNNIDDAASGNFSLYENSDLNMETLKRIAMNLSSDEALEHLAQFSFPFKNQLMNDLDVDGCLADIESLGSPNLMLPDHKEVLPNGYFPDFFSSMGMPDLNFSGETLANFNNDIIKLSPETKITQEDGESTSIRSILKKKVNKNESLELQSLFNMNSQDDVVLETPQLPDSNLQKMRIDQLKRFYSTDFYPDLENDEDYVRSLRSTQSKYNRDLYA